MSKQRRNDGNKSRINILVDPKTHVVLKMMHDQQKLEMGRTSWNKFIETVLIKGMNDDSVKGLLPRYLGRMKEGG